MAIMMRLQPIRKSITPRNVPDSRRKVFLVSMRYSARSRFGVKFSIASVAARVTTTRRSPIPATRY